MQVSCRFLQKLLNYLFFNITESLRFLKDYIVNTTKFKEIPALEREEEARASTEGTITEIVFIIALEKNTNRYFMKCSENCAYI